ncbi:hypothetical protein [Parvularcula sp. LCG005]|uniref:hypothetical protein n=1 Tax=Parvularcula sp. LCG005 TaxID=3078805 RepID=UPI00294290D7|nr:hypothetical protein [Parvularcula sp. LCG005]WOI54496.1 hypothetical protein RUI03_05710 [Parvularcula sp. LCG005]
MKLGKGYMGVVKSVSLALGLTVLGLSAASAQERLTTPDSAQFDSSAFSLGTLTPNSGAANRDLWQRSDGPALDALLAAVPTTYSDPLYLEVLRRITLSPGEGPANADNLLAGRKFLTAAQAGFYRDAASLAELVPGLRSEPALAKVVAYEELLDGEADAACARGASLRDGRTDPFWVRLRHFCYVRAGETSAAELTLDLMRRQDWLADADIDRASAFAADRLNGDFVPQGPIDYAMRADAGLPMTMAQLDAARPMIVAAVARDGDQPADLREKALIWSVAYHTIDVAEARSILNDLPSAQLAGDLLNVTTQPPGTLEMAEAVGNMLGGANGDWMSFKARSMLLAKVLPATEPVMNYAPNAADIAVAGMVTSQPAVVEKWILALAGDGADPAASAYAGSLVELYAILDPGAARRIGSYIGLAFEPAEIAPLGAGAPSGEVPVALFVDAGLDAAQAGSIGPATLVYLMGMKVGTSDETAPIHQAVMSWARAHADLNWLDRQAAFRQAAMKLMAEGGSGGARMSPGGSPVPRVKPTGN